MRINTLNIEQYIRNGFRFEPYEAGEKTKPLIAHLAAILDQLEPQGDDNLHTIWVKAGRPTFRQFYVHHYEFDWPFKEADAAKKEEARIDYAEMYPTPKVWYRLSVKHFSRKPDDEFYALFIDNNYIFGIGDCNSRQVLEGVDLLEWAISEAENVVTNVREETYKTAVLDTIPYTYRTGTIKRMDLWEAFPEAKKDFFKRYKKKELVKFNKTFGEGKAVRTPLPAMTARTFYEACAVVYKSLGMKRDVRSYLFQESDEERVRYGGAGQTPKEMYYANADGRDDGLKNVPMDDPTAFEDWKQGKEPYYEFNGHHPWEIIPSFSTSYSLHLMPIRTAAGGYYFNLSGDSIPRTPDTIIAANALYKAGYPVEVYDLKTIQERLEGNDTVRVVPSSESDLFGESIHLPEGKTGLAVAKRVKWDYIEYKLKPENRVAEK